MSKRLKARSYRIQAGGLFSMSGSAETPNYSINNLKDKCLKVFLCRAYRLAMILNSIKFDRANPFGCDKYRRGEPHVSAVFSMLGGAGL